MRTAFVCNTPYQLFNLLNLFANNLENTDNNTDLFIVDRFRGAEKVYKTVLDLELFNSVFIVTPKEHSSGHLKNRLLKINKSDIGFSEFELSSDKFLKVQYQQVFIGDAMPFGVNLCRYNKEARVIAYEDGIGYYYGDFLHDTFGGIKQKLKRVLKIGRYGIFVDKFYVNKKTMCESTVAKEIVQLPEWNNKNPAISIVNQVFKYKDDTLVKTKKYIFLDRPYSESLKYNNLNPEVLLVKCDIQDNALIRVHPRSSAKYSLVDVDYGENIWELECINNITDNHVLIGDFSLAQVNPKLIGDKEPFLIFVYKLFYDGLTIEEIDNYEKQIDIARKLYSDKNKIYVPQDMTEFKTIIMNFM